MSDILITTPNSSNATTGTSGLVTVFERITIVPDAPMDAAEQSFAEGRPTGTATPRRSTPPAAVQIEVYRDLAEVEAEWRAFESDAVLTPFQSFDWIAPWQRHIGSRAGIRPAIVFGRGADARLLFILPLAVERHGAFRRLCWLASDLCDYNAPVLARHWPERPGQFADVWRRAVQALRSMPDFGFDLVDMSKLPETIGDVRNPFLDLGVLANASNAHITTLSSNWEAYYTSRRSSASRKKDRKQVKYLGEFGTVKFVHAGQSDDLDRTVDTLIAQKMQSFARLGIENLFARPGYSDFYRDVAHNRALIHVSRLDVGQTQAASSLGLTFRGCFYLVLSSYDHGEISRLGPGRAHLRELLRHSTERGLERFDFTIGDELYKRDWSDIELQIYDYVEGTTLKGWPLATAINVYRHTKRFIKKTPALWATYTRLRALAGRLTGHDGVKAEAE